MINLTDIVIAPHRAAEKRIISDVAISGKLMRFEPRSAHDSEDCSTSSESSSEDIEDEDIDAHSFNRETTPFSSFVPGVTLELQLTNAEEVALRPFRQILNGRHLQRTDINAESPLEYCETAASNLHDIGFNNIRRERQGYPKLDNRNIVNIDVEASRVEKYYLNLNKMVVVKTGLSLKKQPPP